MPKQQSEIAVAKRIRKQELAEEVARQIRKEAAALINIRPASLAASFPGLATGMPADPIAQPTPIQVSDQVQSEDPEAQKSLFINNLQQVILSNTQVQNLYTKLTQKEQENNQVGLYISVVNDGWMQLRTEMSKHFTRVIPSLPSVWNFLYTWVRKQTKYLDGDTMDTRTFADTRSQYASIVSENQRNNAAMLDQKRQQDDAASQAVFEKQAQFQTGKLQTTAAQQQVANNPVLLRWAEQTGNDGSMTVDDLLRLAYTTMDFDDVDRREHPVFVSVLSLVLGEDGRYTELIHQYPVLLVKFLNKKTDTIRANLSLSQLKFLAKTMRDIDNGVANADAEALQESYDNNQAAKQQSAAHKKKAAMAAQAAAQAAQAAPSSPPPQPSRTRSTSQNQQMPQPPAPPTPPTTGFGFRSSLKKGRGFGPIQNHVRFMGRGASETFEDTTEDGRYPIPGHKSLYIDLKNLGKSQLTVRYSTSKLYKLNHHLSQIGQMCVQEILFHNTFNRPLFDTLSADEKRAIESLILILGKEPQGYSGPDGLKELYNQFNVLRGEIDAGNHAPPIRAQLRKVTTDLMASKRISRGQGMSIIQGYC